MKLRMVDGWYYFAYRTEDKDKTEILVEYREGFSPYFLIMGSSQMWDVNLFVVTGYA